MIDPWIVRAGYWLTKRRSIMFAPLFTVALVAARSAPTLAREVGQDLVGLLCLAAGTSLRWVAASYHDSSHQDRPITAGPYGLIRHPLYVANFLLGLGIVLVAGWGPMVAVYLVVFLPIHWLIARAEEVHLSQLYGPIYDAYLRAVPAILPLRRFTGERYGSRSRVKLEKGQEGIKIIGYSAGFLAILLLKRWREVGPWLVLPPLSVPVAVAALTVAAVAIVVRPGLRLAWLRAGQTAVAVAGILIVVLHIPGVWPTPPATPPIAVSHPTTAAHS